jgi:hypothetical protein
MKSYFATLLWISLVCGSCAGQAKDSSPGAKSTATQSPEQSASPAPGEDELIREQIQSNWVLDADMNGLETMVVAIAVEMNPDGSVQSAKIDPSTDNGDPNWPVFAQSCLRSLLKSSPLRMPKDKPYEAWRRFSLTFTGDCDMEPENHRSVHVRGSHG